MLMPARLENGDIVVPVRVEASQGMIGDSVKTLKPTDKDYKAWDEWLKQRGALT